MPLVASLLSYRSIYFNAPRIIVRFIQVLAGYVGGTLCVCFKRDFILTVFALTGLFQYSLLWSLDRGFQRGSYKVEFHINRVPVNESPLYIAGYDP